MNKKVGVVIPSYNQHGYLQGAIDSVLTQTYRDFRVVVVNDYRGKPDGEEKAIEIEGLIKERADSRIQLVHNRENKGIAGTRNVAVQQLVKDGVEYIFFLDHDDVWIDPDKIKQQLNVLTRGEIGILGTQFQVIDDVGKIIGESFHPESHEAIKKAILLSCPILMSTLGVNAKVLNDGLYFNEKYNGTDDWEFLLRNFRLTQGGNLPIHAVQYRYAFHNTSYVHWHRLIKEQREVIRTHGVGLNGYHRALLLTYLKEIAPPKYKQLLRRAKKFITPGYEGFSVS